MNAVIKPQSVDTRNFNDVLKKNWGPFDSKNSKEGSNFFTKKLIFFFLHTGVSKKFYHFAKFKCYHFFETPGVDLAVQPKTHKPPNLD
jgi:hypothetical protein